MSDAALIAKNAKAVDRYITSDEFAQKGSAPAGLNLEADRKGESKIPMSLRHVRLLDQGAKDEEGKVDLSRRQVALALAHVRRTYGDYYRAVMRVEADPGIRTRWKKGVERDAELGYSTDEEIVAELRAIESKECMPRVVAMAIMYRQRKKAKRRIEIEAIQKAVLREEHRRRVGEADSERWIYSYRKACEKAALYIEERWPGTELEILGYPEEEPASTLTQAAAMDREEKRRDLRALSHHRRYREFLAIEAERSDSTRAVVKEVWSDRYGMSIASVERSIRFCERHEWPLGDYKEDDRGRERTVEPRLRWPGYAAPRVEDEDTG
ncbi:MAG: hypothetical protein WKF67_06930 [Rubrobacteraceae bacterium]